jgi:hypothetical protein
MILRRQRAPYFSEKIKEGFAGALEAYFKEKGKFAFADC